MCSLKFKKKKKKVYICQISVGNNINACTKISYVTELKYTFRCYLFVSSEMNPGSKCVLGVISPSGAL